MKVGRKDNDGSHINTSNHSKRRTIDGYWCDEAKGSR